MKLRQRNLLVALCAIVLAVGVALMPSSASAASIAKKTARFDSSAAKSSCKLTVKSIKGDPGNVKVTVQAIARSRAFPGLANNRDTTVFCGVYDGNQQLLALYSSTGDFYVNASHSDTLPASASGYVVCGQSLVDLRYGDDVFSSPIVCA